MSIILLNNFKAKSREIPFLSNLTLWLDAADTSTITELGGSVSQIDDKSGYNNHATQSTFSNQPLYETTSLNNLNTLLFNKHKFMRTIDNVLMNDNLTVFLIVNNMSHSPGGNNDNADFFRNESEGGAVTYIDNTTNGKYSMFNGIHLRSDFPVNNDTALLTSIFNSTDSFLRRNKIEILRGNTGTISFNEKLSIADLWTDGEIGELILYNRVLREDEINKVETYLDNKWRISAISLLLGSSLWLDAADENTITESGNNVSQWDDKSINNNNVVQSIATNQPIYGTTTLNGLNTIYFNGGKFMITENNVVIDDNITVFMVINNSNTLGANANFFRAVDELGAVTYINSTSSNQYAMFNGVVLQSATSAVNDSAVLTSIFNGVNSKLRRNGTQIVSGNAGNETNTNQLQIANTLLDGEYGEFIYFNRVLTQVEIEIIESYLMNKWGV